MNELDAFFDNRTITIKGAGNHCDGQVLVTADLLGLSAKLPPFAKPYANLRQIILDSVTHFSEDVKSRQFPES